jgi:hypothetical protein
MNLRVPKHGLSAVQIADVGCVHAEETGNEGQREEYHGYDRELDEYVRFWCRANGSKYLQSEWLGHDPRL